MYCAKLLDQVKYVCNIKCNLIPYYLAPGGGCEVLFSPGLSVCVAVCVSVCQYFGILFLGY